MSASKASQNSRVKILETQPYCIFCGGSTKAVTIDHVPPKIIFKNKQWPLTFEFSACASCNNGSKEQDQLAGFLARLSNAHSLNLIEEQEINKLVKAIERHHPNVLKVMNGLNSRDKRAFSRETGMLPKYGQTFDDLPVVKIPEEINLAIAVQAAKISKALCYKHSGKIVPLDASIRFRGFTNVNVMRGDSPLIEDVMRIVTSTEEINRNNSTLKDQFDYKYAISPEKDIAVFLCVFGSAFGFISFITFNPEILEKMIVNIRENEKFQGEGFQRIYWPQP